MHMPRKKKDQSKNHDHDDYDDDSLVKIDPQLRYNFQPNYQVNIFLIFVRTYVIHLLGTYATILCN